MPKRDKNAAIIISILSVVAFIISYSYISSIYKSYEVEIQERNLFKEIAKLENENELMRKQLDYITTPSFIEREAKRELGLKKPGEKVIIVESDENIVRANKPEEKPIWATMSNPERWLHYFLYSNQKELD